MRVLVHVGSILHSYTGGKSEVEVHVDSARASVHDVLDALETRYPGIRFRIVDEQDHIRPHVRIYVGAAPVKDLKARVGANDQVHVLAALSGG